MSIVSKRIFDWSLTIVTNIHENQILIIHILQRKLNGCQCMKIQYS